MSDHVFVPDKSRSIAYGLPLAEEPGLGTLTLVGFIREVTVKFRDREALVFPEGGDVSWTYADLWDRSVEVAKALIAGGISKGERVGILMTNRPEFLSATFGAALAGAVATPLSTFSTVNELRDLMALSSCSVLLLERAVLKKDFAQMVCEIEPLFASSNASDRSTQFPFLRRLAAVGGDGIGCIESWNAFIASGKDIDDALVKACADTVAPADPGVLFFSSGSTGKPKGISSAHRGVSIQMWRMKRQQLLDENSRYWTANGYFWSGNFSMALGATLAAGGCLVLQRTFDPAQAIDLMSSQRATFLFAWPHQWAQLEAAPNWMTADLSSLTHIDVDSPLAKQPTIKTSWIEPRHCYGNTETFTLSAAYPSNTPRDVAKGSFGLPLPGNTLKIVDPLTGETLPLGEKGELAVKGPTLMLGYLGTPLDETLDAEGFFRTGDGGSLDADGRLFWDGRLNDIIKTGGANVSPVEIDDVIRTCPGIKLSQTVGVPHATLGEVVVSCIVLHEGASVDAEGIRTYAKEQLASYKVPRHILFVDETELQLTGSAKVKTTALRDLAQKMLGEAA